MKNRKAPEHLGGVLPVLPTPFLASGEIDYSSFGKVIAYAVGCQVDGVVYPGLASEYEQLTHEERLATTAFVAEELNGRVPFVVGASATTLELAIQYATAGLEVGAVCAMVMAPNIFASDMRATTEFFGKLAASANIPIMVQNAPAPIGAALSVDNVVSLLNMEPRLRYVKEETMPCGQRIEQILAHAPKSLIGIFGGAGGRHIIDELNRGSLGTFPASEVTEGHVALVEAHRSGDADRARDIFQRMLPILNMQAVFRCNLTKQVLLLRGLVESASVRAPGPVMDVQDIEELRRYWPLVEDLTGALGQPIGDKRESEATYSAG